MFDLPMPDQLAATAKLNPGQGAPATVEPVQAPPDHSGPTTGVHKPHGSRAFWHWARLVTVWTAIGLVIAVLAAHRVNGPPPPTYVIAHGTTIVLAAALGVLVVFWIFVAVAAYLRLIWRTTGEAMRPIPSLAEIEQQLRREGHDPSIADVEAGPCIGI
jgi:hypothetical protein